MAGLYTSAGQEILIPQRQPSLKPRDRMGMPILDDVNGPMRPGAGYRFRPVKLFEVGSDEANKIFCQFCSRH